MAKFTTITINESDWGWNVKVDGIHYANADTLTEIKAALADRPFPSNCEAGEVEFEVQSITCRIATEAGAQVVFPNAKIAAYDSVVA